MRFSVVFAIIALATTASARQQASAQDVSNNIAKLTTKSQNLIAPAQELSILNAPKLLRGGGPWTKVVLGLGDIATGASTLISIIGGTKGAFAGDDAVKISASFHSYTLVHVQLLNILIGKAKPLPQIPFAGPPVVAVLHLSKNALDVLAKILLISIDSTSTVVHPLKTDRSQLGNVAQKAIAAYTI